MFVNFLQKWAKPCVAILPESGTATAVPAAPPTVQISKRSSQSYTGLTAILHTTLDHLYTDHFALSTPGITSIQKCIICGERILWFIGNVQELIHSTLRAFNFTH